MKKERELKRLYKSELFFSILFTHHFSNYEYLIALLACGYHQEFLKHYAAFRFDKLSKKEKLDFVVRLATFLPELADSLLLENPALFKYKKFIKASLFYYLGKKEELANLISSVTQREQRKNPEWYLLFSSVENVLPQKQLENTNLYLNAFKLQPISLIHNHKKLNTLNVTAKPNYVISAKPLVTILVTTYNSEKYIYQTLLSLLNQSYQNIEIIVIDDKSNDNTVAIIEDVMSCDARVKLVKQAVNAGTFIAKNIGIEYASGEFVTCNDSDDWAHPQKIEKQIQPLLENNQLVATFSDWVRLDENGACYTRKVFPFTRLNPSSALFRLNEVKNNMGLWDTVRIAADSEFNERLKLHFPERTLMLNLPLTFGAHRANSLMTQAETGYLNGVSRNRLTYWESWHHWHSQCLKKGIMPKIPPLNATQRTFKAPKEILVSAFEVGDSQKNLSIIESINE